MKKRIALAVVLLLAGGAGYQFFRIRAAMSQRYDVVSIKTLPQYQDAALLQRAWALPVAAKYANPPLSQTNPSACGPASVANVLRSVALEGSQDSVAAHGAGCVFGVCMGGLTLMQLAAAATAVNPKWTVTPLQGLTLDAFREELKHVNDPSRRYVVNFHRGFLFGQGGGHHSPLGAYLEAEDLVLVVDVNASFGPWLVPSERLFQAVDTLDSSSGGKRGLLRIAL